MANLPPRPESPLRMPPREERRHIPDDRDRDRRSAQPMAPRFRPERLPERERSYMPRPRLDTYIAPGFDARRDLDRERDRVRDHRRDVDIDTRERDRRNWERQQRERERERERSPDRRRSSLERDHHPFSRDRGPPLRRPLSPRRPGPPRRDSRSPPPRRRFSRSPPPYYRGRVRSRSRSRSPRHSPQPQRRIRLGNHSITTSPRSRSSRSPPRRRYSRERSPTDPKRSIHRLPSPSKETTEKTRAELSPRPQEDAMDTAPIVQPGGTSVVAYGEAVIPSSAPVGDTHIYEKSKSNTTPNAVQETVPLPSTSAPEVIKHEPKPSLNLKTAVELPHSQPVGSPSLVSSSSLYPPASAMKKEEEKETPDIKMDGVESPKLAAITSNNSIGSASPKPSPIINDYNRGPPTGPRWQARSPPRGPRHHPRPLPTSQPSTSLHQSTPRGPRRDFRSSTSSYPISTPKSGPSLPPIPRYVKPPPSQLTDLELELSKIQNHRANLASEHYQQMKVSRRALQELDMATIDLQAAEGRRQIANMQLEKAKTGSLGIDAPLTDFRI